MMGVVNPNSPLVWDHRMTDALLAWAEAGQPVIVTPFLLARATAPVSLAGGLAQQLPLGRRAACRSSPGDTRSGG